MKSARETFRELHAYQNEPWREEAACKGKPTEWWYPDKGHSKGDVEKARAICRTCPVIDDCLRHALERVELGIWGNTGMKTRQNLRAQTHLHKHLVCHECRNVFHRPAAGSQGMRPFCSSSCARRAQNRRRAT